MHEFDGEVAIHHVNGIEAARLAKREQVFVVTVHSLHHEIDGTGSFEIDPESQKNKQYTNELEKYCCGPSHFRVIRSIRCVDSDLQPQKWQGHANETQAKNEIPMGAHASDRSRGNIVDENAGDDGGAVHLLEREDAVVGQNAKFGRAALSIARNAVTAFPRRRILPLHHLPWQQGQVCDLAIQDTAQHD